MKHLWSGVAVALMSLAATAAAQAPLSPSGAVNSRTAAIVRPPPPPRLPRPRRRRRDRPASLSSPDGRQCRGPGRRARALLPTRDGDAAATEAASPAGSENKTAVARPKRPVRGAERDGSRPSGSAASRGNATPAMMLPIRSTRAS